jgi:Zn-dependent protease with chaperone function
MNGIEGEFFDGKSARSHAVKLRVENGALSIEGDGIARRDACNTLTISERLGNTPRTITFPDAATLVVRESDALERALHDTALSSSFAASAPNKKTWVVASVLAFMAIVALGYSVGLPWAAKGIAFALPQKALDAIGDGAIGTFDRMGFAETKLPETRRNEIIKKFSALKPHTGDTKVRRILFRSSPEHGANAVALPDGTMVVTDELVALAQNDTQIMGVMCHELGHVAHRHGAQNVVQGAMIAAFLSVYLGDFSTIVTGAAATLAASRYSRDAEREADDYSIAMMKANKLPPAALSQLLARMDNDYRAKKKVGKENNREIMDYFSSHPGTAERIARIEAAK